MFTCPPYFNLELYECGEFKDINDYNNDGCISINDVTDIQRKIANILWLLDEKIKENQQINNNLVA